MIPLPLLFLFQTTRLEAEAGQLHGVSVESSRAHSGAGYVTGFDQDADRIDLALNAKAGLYRVSIGYFAKQEKGYVLKVNGSRYNGMFSPSGDHFRSHDAGLVDLKEGSNTISIEKGWGYFDIDWIDVTPAPKPRSPKPVAPSPANRNANKEARELLARLASTYGSKVLSGQYEPKEVGLINEISGKRPVILGFDFMEYSPSRIERGADTDLMTERMIRYGNMGYVLTASWHWNAPSHLLDREITNERGEKVNAKWYKGFYSNATTFDVEKALANPTSPEHKLLIRDIDAIAIELKKVQRAGLPLLWRPLHEAEGKWFWWGAKGPMSFVQLWRLVFNRLTAYHKLNNLLWVASSGTKPEWYPGDAYVDIVGIDAYPQDWQDPLSGTWEALLNRFDGRKMLAITEFGGVPDPDRMWLFGSKWLYWVSWVGGLGPSKNKPEDLRRVYSSERVLTSRTFAPRR
ncbi:MAG TPA: glycosyl hydrolase [Fimbriimonas sp.]|nr:glycosyl hydrolase [Fimbriimonas sp.]